MIWFDATELVSHGSEFPMIAKLEAVAKLLTLLVDSCIEKQNPFFDNSQLPSVPSCHKFDIVDMFLQVYVSNFGTDVVVKNCYCSMNLKHCCCETKSVV